MVQFGPITLEDDDWFEGWTRDAGANSAAAEVLTGTGEPTATSTSEPPPSLFGDIVTRENYGAVRALELEELLSATSLQPIAVTTPAMGDDGYYVVDGSTTREDISSRGTDGSVRIGGVSLMRAGTQQTHFRALEANPRQVDHEFGNGLERVVGVPAAARKVRYYDPETTVSVPADADDTVSGEFGDVDLFDLDVGADALEADVGEVTLIYEIDYADEAPMDCKVYDTIDARSESKYVETDSGQTVRIWESVFSTGHDPRGTLVLDNGLVRLRLDEGAGTLEAQEWDAGAEEWVDVLEEDDQPAEVELYDVDLVGIGMVRDRAQLTFDVDGGLFALDVMLHRGADSVQVALAESETGPTSSSVEEWLAPIVSESIVDPNASKTLVSRQEVRK